MTDNAMFMSAGYTDYTAGTVCRRRGGMVLGYRYGLAMAHTTITMTTGREGGNEERPIHLLKPETGRCQPSPSTTVTALSIYSVLSVSSSPTPFNPPQYAYAWGYIYIYTSFNNTHTRVVYTPFNHRQHAHAWAYTYVQTSTVCICVRV